MKVSISPDVVSEIAGGEVVLLDLKRGIYFALDSVGSRLWGLLQQGADVESAQAMLLNEYEVTPEQLERDVERLLEELSGRGLLKRSQD
jgi:hypothetical protein